MLAARGLSPRWVYPTSVTWQELMTNKNSPGGSTTADPVLPLRSPGILVVDDDPGILALLALVLRDHGFQVLLATDGTEAVDLYSNKHAQIDLVLIDVMMGVMHGPQAMAAIKQINPQVRFCFMSGYPDQWIAQDLIDAGAAHVFQKPFSILGTVQVLKDMVGLGAARA